MRGTGETSMSPSQLDTGLRWLFRRHKVGRHPWRQEPLANQDGCLMRLALTGSLSRRCHPLVTLLIPRVTQSHFTAGRLSLITLAHTHTHTHTNTSVYPNTVMRTHTHLEGRQTNCRSSLWCEDEIVRKRQREETERERIKERERW